LYVATFNGLPSFAKLHPKAIMKTARLKIIFLIIPFFFWDLCCPGFTQSGAKVTNPVVNNKDSGGHVPDYQSFLGGKVIFPSAF
jgi:hypothetical protein